MASKKKQSFIAGAAILAASSAIVKLIGAVYKIPLNNILGDEGKAYFQTAYEIYNVLLTISTAGLPVAISRLTSEARAKGLENEKRKIFRTAIWLFMALGLIGSGLMFFGSSQLANFQNNSMAAFPIWALSPSVFCVCLLSCMRGYTQGQGDMTPSAVSQVVEALCKLGIGLPLAWYALRLGFGLDIAAGGAIFGVTLGTVLSMFYLIFYMLTHRNSTRSLDVPSSSGRLMQRVLAIAVPITLSNSAISVITMIDTKVIFDRLENGLGMTEQMAVGLKGQYSYAMDMLNLVSSFVVPVTLSLIPFAASALAKKDYDEVGRMITNAFRIIAALAIPAGVGLSALSTPIMVLMLPYQPEGALAAGPHLQILGIACIFVCLMTLSNVILQTYGKELIPICTVIIGGIIKVSMNYVLVGNPDINIHGARYSTLCCYMVIVLLNLFFVWKYSPRKPAYLKIFVKPVVASVLMGGAAWAVHGFLNRALSAGHSAYGANAIATMAGIIAGVVVYAILVIALRILRAEDLQSIPRGQKLAKILHLK